MLYKMNDIMTLRIPLLPYKYSLIEYPIKYEIFGDDVLNMFNILDIENDQAKVKYIKRMSYRTTPLFGMVSENLTTSNSDSKIQINNLDYLSTVDFTTDRYLDIFEKNPDCSITASYFVIEDKMYYKYLNKEEKYIILRNDITDYIFRKTLNQSTTKEELFRDASKFSIPENDLYDLINNLISTGFLIISMTINENHSIKNQNFKLMNRRSSKLNAINIPDSQLKKIGKLISLLDNENYIDGYNELFEYFTDKYNDSHVFIDVLFRDKEFSYLFNNLSIKKKNSSDLINYIKNKIDVAIINKKRIVNIQTRNLIRKEIKDGMQKFDIHCNLLNINGKDYINLDNQRSIKNKGCSNVYIETSNIKSINYASNDVVENSMLSPVKKNNISINVITEDNNEAGPIYVGIDLEKGEFYVVDKKNQKLKVNKLSKLDSNRFDEKVLMLLYLSDLDNFDKSINFDVQLNEYPYSPRIIFDDNYILARERWIIHYNELLNSTLDLFIDQLDSYIKEYHMPKIICLIDEDKELLIDLYNVSERKYLYNHLKVNKKLLFKEDLQQFSSIKVNREKHCNELILTFEQYDSKVEFSKNKPLIKKDNDNLNPFTEWTFFEIYINEIEINYMNFFIKLREFLNETPFFYIFYTDQFDIMHLRVRVMFKDLKAQRNMGAFLNDIIEVNEFSILPYQREVGRYFTMGIESFELFSSWDTKRIIDTYLTEHSNTILLDDEEKYKVLISNTLFLLDSLDISEEKRFILFKKYITGRQSRDEFNFFSKLIKEFNCEVESHEVISELKTLSLNIEEVLSIIHVSNIRLIGNSIELEKNVYKNMGIYYEKIKWRKFNGLT